MIRQCIKQALAQARQNKVFTAIYIGGVAIAIATTMIFAIIYYVKLAPIYPEANRDRTLYLRVARFEMDNGNSSQWAWSLQAVREMFYPMKTAEVVSAENTAEHVSYIQPFDNSGDIGIFVRHTDPGFFKIYEFDFVDGKPFTEADLSSGSQVAVITESIARKVFGTAESVTGKTFSIDYLQYRVAGVVKDCSTLASDAYGDAFIPYSAMNFNVNENEGSYYGSYEVKLLVPDTAGAVEAANEEVAELIRKYNAKAEGHTLNIFEDPVTHVEKTFQEGRNRMISWSNIIRQYGIVVLVLLLVPALNLSGMIAGRMDARLMEIGVRKSYGASRSVLLNQVLIENFVLTIIGGVIGLMMSWGILAVCRNWIFTIADGHNGRYIYQADISGEMLFAPTVFGVALLVCVILNLISAFIPAWNSLRRPIVESLNEKR